LGKIDFLLDGFRVSFFLEKFGIGFALNFWASRFLNPCRSAKGPALGPEFTDCNFFLASKSVSIIPISNSRLLRETSGTFFVVFTSQAPFPHLGSRPLHPNGGCLHYIYVFQQIFNRPLIGIPIRLPGSQIFLSDGKILLGSFGQKFLFTFRPIGRGLIS
jgi:hypothetical protein